MQQPKHVQKTKHHTSKLGNFMNELQQTYMIISTWTVIRTIMQTQKKTEWGLYVPCKTGSTLSNFLTTHTVLIQSVIKAGIRHFSVAFSFHETALDRH